MARYDSATDPSDADIESDALSTTDNDALTPGETSPLLQNTDLPADVAPPASFQRIVIAMCLLFLFIIEVSVFILNPAMQQIMEDIICRGQYPDHLLNLPRVQDNRCKGTDVQKTLAMVRSWGMSAEMFFPLLVQVPYGIVADKYGRRPVIFLALFGCVLQQTWTLIVLFFPDRFSIWAVIYGDIAYLIGGGGQMAMAMLWTILADAIPVAKRTAIFLQLYAVTLLLAVVVNPIAAALLTVNPWIAIWVGYGILIVGTLSTLLIPETLKFRQAADLKRRREQAANHPQSQESDESTDSSVMKKAVLQQAWFTMKNDMSHIWHFIFASKSVLLLIAAYGLFFILKLAFSLDLLQYMSKRFNLDWSTATYLNTISAVGTMFLLLAVLPIASSVLTKSYGYSPVERDLLLARASIILSVIGCFLTALAGVPWMFILALVVTSFGNGFSVLCRALLNAVVEPHTVATLNTTISTTETLAGLISAPAIGWLLSRGFELGGMWMGLPYFVSGILAVGAMFATYLFRIPAGFAQASRS